MALSTKNELRSLNIYQVFLRQHTKEGTFLSLIDDLPRIKSLGMNFIYLLPIHPIGKINRKGTIGSPYSVIDYYAIDESYGTIKDFKTLIKEADKLDLKIMLDMVFHHTAYDSIIYKNNPNWYFLENGLPSQKIKDWSDVIDLDFSHEDLEDYLIDVLLYWVKLGVKGFRFDVASLIPLDFWLKARKRVLKEDNDILFLGESVHINFIKQLRDKGYNALSDSELYQAFDILYDYDISPYFYEYIDDSLKLNNWLKAILNQEMIYPKNYVKLRNLENHDTKRIAYYIKDTNKLLNLTALLGFLKGSVMIYAAQEYKEEKRPSLFEIDKIDLNEKEEDIRNLIHRISHLRKDDLFQDGIFKIYFQDYEVAVMSYENEMSIAYGIFNLGSIKDDIYIDLKDGVYQNILYPQQVKVDNKKLRLSEKPMILFAMKTQI